MSTTTTTTITRRHLGILSMNGFAYMRAWSEWEVTREPKMSRNFESKAIKSDSIHEKERKIM
jgi:hypothetical protein